MIGTLEEALKFLSRDIENQINVDIQKHGRATLMLTGGNSIRQFLYEIAKIKVDWQKVNIILSDDRLVSIDDPNSNEGMIKREFMNLPGPNMASYISIKTMYENYQKGDYRFLETLKPLSYAVLSMGTDGHVASLFPDNLSLFENEDILNKIERPDFTRITFSLNFLLKFTKSAILMCGKEKIDFYNQLDTQSFPLIKFFKKSALCKIYF